MEVTNHLISVHGFDKINDLRKPEDSIDIDKFTCMKRIHELHYLFYSEDDKYFTLAMKYSKPKGQPGGGYKFWNMIMIPKLIKSVVDADKLIYALEDK